MEQKLTHKKQALLERNAKIKKRYESYVANGYMRTTSAANTALDMDVSVSTVYLAIKS